MDFWSGFLSALKDVLTKAATFFNGFYVGILRARLKREMIVAERLRVSEDVDKAVDNMSDADVGRLLRMGWQKNGK